MKSINAQLTKSFTKNRVAGLLAGCMWIAGSVPAAIGAVAFTVDPGQSYVSISGSVVDSPLHEQGAGSLTTRYEGTLLAEVSGNAILFPGQSHIVALNSGNWQPLSDGSGGSAPANYGATASAFWSTGVAAARDVQVDITSGTIALVNGQFDTQGITATIPAGGPSSLAYRVQGAFDDAGSVALGGESATGQFGQGSLVTVGGQQVLTIPINYTFYFNLMSPNDTTVTLTGQLVATRPL